MPDNFHYLDDPGRTRIVRELTPTVVSAPPLGGFDTYSVFNGETNSSGRLAEYLRTFYRHKFTLIAMGVVGFIVSLALSLPQKPIYRAHALLEIQDLNANVLNKGFDSGPTEGNDAAETNFQTQIRLLQSESLLERVGKSLKLHVADTKNGQGLSLWRTLLHLPPKPKPPENEKILQLLQSNLIVRVSGQTRIVEVLYDSPDPMLAAQVPNALINEFIEQSQELRWDSTKRTGEWLTRQLAEMKVKLERSEAQLAALGKVSGIALGAPGRDSIQEAKLRELEDELSKAQADRLSKQSQLEMATQSSPDSLPEMLDDPTIREYTLRLTDLRRQLAELSSALTPAHPKVQQVEDEIAALTSALDKQRSATLRRIATEYEAAKRHEALLAAASFSQTKVVSKETDEAVQYNMLKQEVDTSRQLYETLLQRVKEAGVASAMRASNILLIDPARRPLLPYKPNFLMNCSIGLFGGLFIGVGLVFLREQTNSRVRDRGELTSQLNVPELGAIPEFRSKFLQMGPYAKSSRSVGKLSELDNLELVAWNRKPSLVAESFRATLPSILFGQVTEKRPRVIVMTSPNPGEGKTVIATNLAIAIGEITRRVLLIDGDLRRPRVHRIFKSDNTYGLADLLSAAERLTMADVTKCVQKTEVPGLFLLTSGSEKDDVASLFYSRRLPELIRLLRDEYDTIVIDTPPILQAADGRLLARFADGVIMVVRSGQTVRDTALLAYQRVTEDGSPVLGTILNSWDPGNVSRYVYANRR